MRIGSGIALLSICFLLSSSNLLDRTKVIDVFKQRLSQIGRRHFLKLFKALRSDIIVQPLFLSVGLFVGFFR